MLTKYKGYNYGPRKCTSLKNMKEYSEKMYKFVNLTMRFNYLDFPIQLRNNWESQFRTYQKLNWTLLEDENFIKVNYNNPTRMIYQTFI